MSRQIKFFGKVFIIGNIKVLTGLHIGRDKAGIDIGGLDNPVIRNSNNEPYIPGSSLKGKLRSLSEKLAGLPPNFPPIQEKQNQQEDQRAKKVQIHVCESEEKYKDCHVCHIFGAPGDKEFSTPTRLIVRDVTLDTNSLAAVKTDLEYTEIKYEVTIDRITSAANPRPIERVPEGAIFKDFEFCYSIYEKNDLDRLKTLFKAMELLEDDYLGGSGSRGSGKIKFEDIKVECRSASAYGSNNGRKKYNESNESIGTMEKLLEKQDCIVVWLEKEFNLRGENHENSNIQAQP